MQGYHYTFFDSGALVLPCLLLWCSSVSTILTHSPFFMTDTSLSQQISVDAMHTRNSPTGRCAEEAADTTLSIRKWMSIVIYKPYIRFYLQVKNEYCLTGRRRHFLQQFALSLREQEKNKKTIIKPTQSNFFAAGCIIMQHYVTNLYNIMQHYVIRGDISPNFRRLIAVNNRFCGDNFIGI